jgi:hypothetical protein
MNYTQSHPNLGPPAEKTKSKERNLSYNPPFSEATRNESAEATHTGSENGREVMGPG